MRFNLIYGCILNSSVICALNVGTYANRHIIKTYIRTQYAHTYIRNVIYSEYENIYMSFLYVLYVL